MKKTLSKFNDLSLDDLDAAQGGVAMASHTMLGAYGSRPLASSAFTAPHFGGDVHANPFDTSGWGHVDAHDASHFPNAHDPFGKPFGQSGSQGDDGSSAYAYSAEHHDAPPAAPPPAIEAHQDAPPVDAHHDPIAPPPAIEVHQDVPPPPPVEAHHDVPPPPPPVEEHHDTPPVACVPPPPPPVDACAPPPAYVPPPPPPVDACAPPPAYDYSNTPVIDYSAGGGGGGC